MPPRKRYLLCLIDNSTGYLSVHSGLAVQAVVRLVEEEHRNFVWKECEASTVDQIIPFGNGAYILVRTQ